MLSVIVITYNPQWNKLKKTILSILQQKEIDVEIVVADDGSKEPCFEEIKTLFEEYDFTNYQFVENKENQGTIKNFLSGIAVANGEYVYGISPGDFLFDELTLKAFYEYALKKDIDILFGDVLHYKFNNGKVSVESTELVPKNPTTFNEEKDLKKAKREFALGEHITGPGYFRKKEIAKQYLNKTLEYGIKYVEDTTSSILALSDNIRIVHYDRPICWYEEGLGITSNKKAIVFEEIKTVYHELNKQKNYPAIDCACIRMDVDNNFKRKALCLIKHPIIYVKHYSYKSKLKKDCYYDKFDKQQLQTSIEKILL